MKSHDEHIPPVLFIAFNRPDLAAVTFEKIRRVRPSQLFFAVDGPRNGFLGEMKRCCEVRALVEKIDWACDLKTLFRENNLGCKRAVSSAISWFFDAVESGIILEDDCCPEDSFFGFCGALLNRYRENQRIMHISGDNFQFGRRRGQASYYFSRYNHNWGWATWRRAWRLYDVAMTSFPEFLTHSRIDAIIKDPEEKQYWLAAFERTYQGQIDTWDYQWTYTLWRHDGLAILPNQNLVKNIGFRDDATHTVTESIFADLDVVPMLSIEHPEEIVIRSDADHFTYQCLRGNRIPKDSQMEIKVSEAESEIDQKIEAAVDYLNAGSPDMALHQFETVLAASPEYHACLYGKALAQYGLGRAADAAATLGEYLCLSPEDQGAKTLLARWAGHQPVKSPLNGSDMVRLVKQIKPSFIIDAYRRFNVDVSGYFTDISTVDVYECIQTGYRFYHPLRLAGGEDLYRQLETISWYYMDWKWEHQVALDHLAANSRVLEVGCARGGFLRQCHRQGHEVMGLELNAKALSHAVSAGLNVAHMTIEDFAKAKHPSFDAVCSFQVLEHIPDCHCFIKHCLAALKPGGRLILSVPNNDAFMLKSDPVQTLNMPPHHMGLWTPNAMVSLGFLFEMQLEKLEFEPLQSYHRDYSTSLVKGLLREKRESENRRGESLPEAVVCEVAAAVLEQVPGHTLLAVFRKNGEC